jgi:hypothetical protein
MSEVEIAAPEGGARASRGTRRLRCHTGYSRLRRLCCDDDGLFAPAPALLRRRAVRAGAGSAATGYSRRRQSAPLAAPAATTKTATAASVPIRRPGTAAADVVSRAAAVAIAW